MKEYQASGEESVTLGGDDVSDSKVREKETPDLNVFLFEELSLAIQWPSVLQAQSHILAEEVTLEAGGVLLPL